MLCEVASSAGFLSGLWAGLIGIFSLMADIFFDVTLYDHCQQSWWYDLGFVIGMLLTGGLLVDFSPVILLILFIAWLISFTFKAFAYGLAFMAGALVVYKLYQYMRQKTRP